MLLCAPEVVVYAVPRSGADSTVRIFARLLGVRQLVEAAVVGRHASSNWLVAGAAIDATHSASMLALAAARPARRRLVLANAIVAATFAGVGTAQARKADRCALRRRDGSP
ncbi:MAG: hypothetical protein H0X39_17010 [Actinobacteria bacterium]|nr:hypothetical protein [Actinomycetota bacterium]